MKFADLSSPKLLATSQRVLLESANRLADQLNRNQSVESLITGFKADKRLKLRLRGWTVDQFGWWHHPRNPGMKFGMAAALLIQKNIDAHSHLPNINQTNTILETRKP